MPRWCALGGLAGPVGVGVEFSVEVQLSVPFGAALVTVGDELGRIAGHKAAHKVHSPGEHTGTAALENAAGLPPGFMDD